ncbi:hypothetical protein KCU81_g1204, partial [Aureobasidium melanogenum]|uniref:tRNA(Phe) (4-demethylwyosine(37)-C(7)) aminocarboxypropyltransferase n=1 Tax=Aureobasidium melanogenum (strain CBS 110374) TaxID=1043003 RepID=A0A074W1B1_AURM1
MEPWSNLLSNLEPDEIESIYLAGCDQRLSYPFQTTEPPSTPQRHDSGVAGVSPEEDDTKLTQRSNDVSPPQEHSIVVCKQEQPTQDDFDNAAWVSTKQNGVTHYWAPRYTASPHSNASHSARMLYMSSLKTLTITKGTRKGCTAVDLSAGSGAIALNYAAAGVQKVLCWDANPWSIEGLRRGAIKNRWHVQVYHGDRIQSKTVKVSSKTRVMAFVEDGEKASSRILGLRNSLPPVRHVNCGLAPTSRNLHAVAAAVLDPKLGGWIHVHETCRVEEVVYGANKTRAELEAVVETLDRERGYLTDVKEIPRRPVVQHIQRIGSDAPGVLYCIVDIHIPPIRI